MRRRPSVNCAMTCETCGWNPVVAEARIAKAIEEQNRLSIKPKKFKRKKKPEGPWWIVEGHAIKWI